MLNRRRTTSSRITAAALLVTLWLATPRWAQGASREGLAGDWLVRIAMAADGSMTAVLDSPGQGARGIPIDAVTFNEPAVKLEAPRIAAVFERQMSDDGLRILGTWMQAGRSIPLTLERQTATTTATRSRPQGPVAPYPYDAEDVTFTNPDDGVMLAGTLTLPRAVGPHAAVVLISGSGPQDRDHAALALAGALVLALWVSVALQDRTISRTFAPRRQQLIALRATLDEAEAMGETSRPRSDGR